jgi:hypothetical protein
MFPRRTLNLTMTRDRSKHIVLNEKIAFSFVGTDISLNFVKTLFCFYRSKLCERHIFEGEFQLFLYYAIVNNSGADIRTHRPDHHTYERPVPLRAGAYAPARKLSTNLYDIYQC